MSEKLSPNIREMAGQKTGGDLATSAEKTKIIEWSDEASAEARPLTEKIAALQTQIQSPKTTLAERDALLEQYSALLDKLDAIEKMENKKRYEGPGEIIKLTIGGKSVEQYEKEMDTVNKQIADDNEKFKIGKLAKQILLKVKPGEIAKEIELVHLTVADLGFTESTRYDELCKKAKELGLELCPVEVGPALRLLLKEQQMNDEVTVAMEPLTDPDDCPRLFNVNEGEDGRWLSTDRGNPGYRWSPGCAFVFVRGKHCP